MEPNFFTWGHQVNLKQKYLGAYLKLHKIFPNDEGHFEGFLEISNS